MNIRDLTLERIERAIAQVTDRRLLRLLNQLWWRLWFRDKYREWKRGSDKPPPSR